MKIDLAGRVEVLGPVVSLVNKFSSGPEAVSSSGDRKDVRKRSGIDGSLQIHIHGCSPENNPACIRRNTNQWQARKDVGISPVDSDVRVLHRLVWGVVYANEVVTDVRFVNGG